MAEGKSRLSLSKGLTATLVPVAVGWVLIAGYATRLGADRFLEILGVGALTGAAALLAGGLLGFLFGIPRTNASWPRKGGPAQVNEDATPAGSRYEPNTNLEQISDWLTKILVGAGLVQLGTIGGAFADLTEVIGDGLGGTSSSRVVAGSSLLYFGAGGFLAGFLLTRLHLGEALKKADEIADLGQEATEAIDDDDPVAAKRLIDKLVSAAAPGSRAAPSRPELFQKEVFDALRQVVPVHATVIPATGTPDGAFDGLVRLADGKEIAVDVKYGTRWTGISLLERVAVARSSGKELAGLLLVGRGENPAGFAHVREQAQARYDLPTETVVWRSAGDTPDLQRGLETVIAKAETRR